MGGCKICFLWEIFCSDLALLGTLHLSPSSSLGARGCSYFWRPHPPGSSVLVRRRMRSGKKVVQCYKKVSCCLEKGFSRVIPPWLLKVSPFRQRCLSCRPVPPPSNCKGFFEKQCLHLFEIVLPGFPTAQAESCSTRP